MNQNLTNDVGAVTSSTLQIVVALLLIIIGVGLYLLFKPKKKVEVEYAREAPVQQKPKKIRTKRTIKKKEISESGENTGSTTG